MFQDLRLVTRRLARSPAWTVAAVSVLALGLGLGATVFAVADALVFRPPPVAEPQRLLNVFAAGDSGVSDYEPVSYPDVRSLRQMARSFASVTAYAPTTVTIETAGGGSGSGSGAGFGTVAELAEPNYFETLGVEVTGRTLDGHHRACDVAVLGAALHRRLGGGPLAELGRLRVNGRPVEPVGVAPDGFRGLTRGLEPELWLSLDCARELQFDAARNVQLGRATPGLDRFEDPRLRWVWLVGRLRDGVDPRTAEAEIQSLGDRHGRRFLVAATAELRLAPDVDRRLAAASNGSLAVAACVLLVACGNVASLLLVRSLDRRREIAARRALGAGTWRILRLLWLEGAVLAALGVGVALGLGAAAARLLASVELPVPIPVELGVAVDARVVVVTGAAALLTSLLFVSAPALDQMRFRGRADLASALRSGSATGGRGQHRLLSASVAAQIAVSLALWIAAATAGQSLLQASAVDPGCRPGGVATARFDLALQGFSAAERADVHGRVATEVARLPGAREVSYASHLPLSMELLLARVAAHEPDRTGSETEPEGIAADWAAVDAGYFDALGVGMLAGRGFTERERDAELPVAVVNLELARALWPGVPGPEAAGDALGRRVWRIGEERPLRVVGVTDTGRYRSLAESGRAFFYRPLPRSAAGARTLLLRFDDPRRAESAQTALRQAIASVEPRLIVHRLQTAEEAMAPSLLVPRTASALLAAFSTLALALTAVGLYGVLGHLVALRRRDIGIRLAVGGAPVRVALETMAGRCVPVLAGVVVGVLSGVLMSGRLAALVRVGSGWQAASVASACALVLAVAAVAAFFPARRAARTDPARVLADE